ncbi:MAG: hypothetical protein ACYTHN_16610, partial [Planctomycetota bacterium]
APPQPAPEPEPEPAPTPPPPEDGLVPHEGDVVVQVTGEGEDERDAENQALRKAVEKGAGVEITSRTETLNYAVAYDNIISRAQGYVKTWRKTRKSKVTRLGAKVWIEAVVAKGKIRDDWGDIQMLLEKAGRPTVVVFIKETVVDDKGGEIKDAGVLHCTAAIESLLQDKGFRLKALDALSDLEKRDRDAAVARNDLDAIAAIAKRHRADVFLKGNAVARYNNKFDSHGLDLLEYRASGQLRAFRTDTGEIIATVKYNKGGTGDGHAAAIEQAYTRVAESLAKGMLLKILNAWYFRFQHGDEIEVTLIIKAPTEKELKKAKRYAQRFKGLLNDINFVDSVQGDDFQKEGEKAFQYFTVKTTLNTDSLTRKLANVDLEDAGFSLEVTGVTKNTVEVILEIGG